MGREMIILSEVCPQGKNKYHTISLICGIQNMAQVNLSTKQKPTHKRRDQPCGFQGADLGRMEGEAGVSRCKLLHTGWTNKGASCGAGSCIQSPGINHGGK